MDTQECIFCKIIQGEIPSTKVYEDQSVIAFLDINPVTPTHILIVPKQHIPSVNDLQSEHENTLGHMVFVGKQLASDKGLSTNGYRLLMNTGQDAGQVVYHLHMHLLGGRRLGPMG